MCLIAFAWQAHPEFPLVVAGNRDEFFARPTASAGWWPDGRRLAGRDLRAGGTWMGVSAGGRFAALTNHRDPTAQRAGAPSRGALVERFLDDDEPAEGSLAGIGNEAARYNGFNLLAGRWREPAGLWIVASPGDGAVRRVEPGVHGLSNARLDTAWPKVDRVVRGLESALAGPVAAEHVIDDLFALLADRRVAPDDHLPSTGVPLEVERALSAPFIRMPEYGTRSSTILLAARDGAATYVERRFEPDVPVEERRFSLPPGPAPLRRARAP